MNKRRSPETELVFARSTIQKCMKIETNLSNYVWKLQKTYNEIQTMNNCHKKIALA